MTKSTGESRRLSIEAALQGWKSTDARLEIPWKGAQQSVEVVKLRLSEVLLNHSSHRIAAQLESYPEWPDLEKDPESDEAQARIAQAIREASPGYQVILKDLSRVGQQQPGVVTRAGVLINGNTRAVALRELEETWISVAVLPPGAGAADIAEVEFKLQVTRDLKQDYTYTNRLLFIQDLLDKHGYTAERIALEMGVIHDTDKASLKKGEQWVDQATKALHYIRNLQKKCQDLTGRPVALTRFDENQQAIEELLDELEEDHYSEADRSEIFYWRTIGLLTGVTKLLLREVKPGFAESFFVPSFEEDESLNPHGAFLLSTAGDASADREKKIPGLSPGIPLPISNVAESQSSTLMDTAIKSLGTGSVPVSAGPNRMTMDSDQFLARLKGVFDEATEAARQERLHRGSLDSPIRALREATRNIELAENRLREMASKGLNLEKFKSHMSKLEKRVKSLKRSFEAVDPRG